MKWLIALAAMPLMAAPVVTSYSAEVRLESPGVYSVKVSASVAGDWPKPVFTVGPFPGEGGALRRMTPADGVVRYHVTAAEKRKYIPLAVPEIAGNAAPGSVEIVVFPGETLNGDTFPLLVAAGEGRWVARMANIVNHVEFETGASTGWGPGQWSDLAVVLMIVGGLIIRKVVT